LAGRKKSGLIDLLLSPIEGDREKLEELSHWYNMFIEVGIYQHVMTRNQVYLDKNAAEQDTAFDLRSFNRYPSMRKDFGIY
jgi:hypothetical protein